MPGSAQVRACLPRKPCSAGKDSWLNAQVRTGPRRICRGNRGPCQVFGLMLGFAAPRRFCREHRAPCWLLGKMLRSAGSRFRSTGAPKMPGNSSNQGHYTLPAVVKCKFPLSELRGEATYYTHRAVAGSRFPSGVNIQNQRLSDVLSATERQTRRSGSADSWARQKQDTLVPHAKLNVFVL